MSKDGFLLEKIEKSSPRIGEILKILGSGHCADIPQLVRAPEKVIRNDQTPDFHQFSNSKQTKEKNAVVKKLQQKTFLESLPHLPNLGNKMPKNPPRPSVKVSKLVRE